jgi:rubrerythrin
VPDERVRKQWLRRIEAEYRSAASTQHLTLWLIQLGAPPELLELGLRIVADELAHAELCADVYREAGGRGAPALLRETLGLTRSEGEPLERDVFRVAVEQFCLGETAAVRIFSRMRAKASVPFVRRALDRILRDEVVHRDFVWTLLEWLLTTPMAEAFTEQLTVELPAMLARQRQYYGGAALARDGIDLLRAQDGALSASARAWGLISSLEYIEAVEETATRDYRSRLERLSLAHAWPSGAREP